MLKLSGLIAQFLQWSALNRASRTTDYYRLQLGKALKLLGDKPASELHPRDFLLLPKSWHMVQACQRLYSWGSREARLIAKNPLRHMRKPRLGQRHRLLTRQEMQTLLRFAAPCLRRFLLALRECSARPQELRCVRWEQLHYPEDRMSRLDALREGAAFFQLEEYKAREKRLDPTTPRVIPISPRLGRLLQRLGRKNGYSSGIVFRNAKKREWNKNTLVCAIRRLRAKTGLALPVRSGREQICAYSFRHTSASKLASEGLPTHFLQSVLGHANVATTLRYVHLNNVAMMRAWRKWHTRGKEDRQRRDDDA